jgi:type I restriction enzyme S subunit
LDENGEPRDRISRPDLFQDSPIGQIQSAWQFLQLKDVVPPDRRITYGIVQPGEFDSNGILLIRGKDYISGWASRDDFFKVAPSRHESYRRSLTKAGDVLLCIVGATTGAVAQVPEWIEESNITQTTARIACNLEKVLPRFAFHVLQSEFGQRQVRRYIKGSAQPGLNLKDVEMFWLPVPRLEEQRLIANVLDSYDDETTATGLELSKLQQFKSGLTTDLLTGRVRVSKNIGKSNDT